ncbi:MAG: hypothetical protein HY965_05605 [Ignavibacteriales bacterium]|nr:hypothetical protein [Ignavibacteriales bacterium]
MRFQVLVIFVFCSFVNLFSQAGTTVFSLPGIQQSTLMMGAGGSGVALPINDAISYYINPAQLGINRQTQFSLYQMTDKAKWLPLSPFNPQLRSDAASVQYDLYNSLWGLPLSVGLGYMHTKLSYGRFVSTGPTGPEPASYYYANDQFTGISFAAGYHSWFDASLGITRKSCVSSMYPNAEMRITAYDFGGMFRVPYSFDAVEIGNTLSIIPKTSFTFGTAITNVGDDVEFKNSGYKDPLSRKSYLGYTLHAGAEILSGENRINFFDYYFTAEADAYLVKRDTTWKFSYTGVYYGLRPLENLIGLRPTKYVSVHKGHVISLFETVYYSTGTERTGNVNSIIRSSEALVFSTEGISKMLAGLTGNKVLSLIANHLVFEYHSSTVHYADSEEPYQGRGDSDFKGIVFRLKNFNLFF